MNDNDPALQALIDRVRAARAAATPLRICGGGSKAFYGEAAAGEAFDVTGLRGISSHQPSELVVTVRAGTPLAELEAALAEHGQCLPFEPPHFGPGATVGGMVSAGLSGPGRAAVGPVRDYVLGATVLNGRAELLSFGGQVMKNVAGYDVSRLFVGAMGTLGVVCEVSLKVLPSPRATATLRFDMTQSAALEQLNRWAGRPLPLNASAWWDGTLVVRLQGAVAAVEAATAAMGGEAVLAPLATDFWNGLREQTDDYFVEAKRQVDADSTLRLWRLSLPQTAPTLTLAGDQLVEWGGAQRWLCSALPAQAVRAAAEAAGGHATIFRAQDKSPGVLTPPTPAVQRIQRELMRAFDPDRLFDRGRLYPGL